MKKKENKKDDMLVKRLAIALSILMIIDKLLDIILKILDKLGL